MKRLAMLAASGLMAGLPSVASARPHFFVGFNLAAPFFAASYFAPPVYCPPPVAYSAPPVVCSAPPVTYVAPPVVYAPAPVYTYYTYSYPAYDYFHRYTYDHRAPVRYGGVTYHYGGYRR
jgi:hypothetical protein